MVWGWVVGTQSQAQFTPDVHIHAGRSSAGSMGLLHSVAAHALNMQRLSGGIRERVAPLYLPLWTTRILDGRRKGLCTVDELRIEISLSSKSASG